MALNVEDPVKTFGAADGATTVFDHYPQFTLSDPSHLSVTVDDVASTAWTQTETGIIFTVAPESGAIVELRRDTPYDQPTEVDGLKVFGLQKIEDAFDRFTRQLQEIAGGITGPEGPPGPISNPFDQDLNTTDSVTFVSVTADVLKYSASHFVSETTTARTLTDADHGKTILCTNASAVTVTVPAELADNFWCTVIQIGAGTVTLDDDSAATTLNTAGDLETADQYASLSIANYGTTDTYLVQ